MRKVVTVIGIALTVAGAFFLFTGASFTSRREVLNVGGLTVSAEERHPLSPWIATLAIIGGIALVISESRRKA